MTNQGRGPRARPDPAQELRDDLVAAFVWRGDRSSVYYGDVAGWWGDGALLARLGPALADLVGAAQPTVILGPQSRGALLGAVVALHLRLGLAEVRKNPGGYADSDAWVCATTPPDYRDRNLRLGVRQERLPVGSRALFVDDWIQTGGQAVATQQIVEAAGAQWLGAAVVVDGLDDPQLRRRLEVRSLLRDRDLRDR